MSEAEAKLKTEPDEIRNPNSAIRNSEMSEAEAKLKTEPGEIRNSQSEIRNSKILK